VGFFLKMNVTELANRARSFNGAILLHEATAIQKSEKVLVNLNKDQMLKSKTANDTTIKPKYSSGYAAYKGFDFPDLKDTGDFQKDMFLVAKQGEFFINSIDWKAPELETKYDNIFGIAPINNAKASAEASKNLLKLEIEKVWRI